ncbi:hypothetical protein HPP92_015094 [Vanilla planifolia]|uniref:NOT2/NOT3/NOT5 C-terminal domain-containing protein n=1 Tax=Vanilla planifolia TaxID=51239 RepID=A0A835QPH9_VANPL|nr:hypothetical protein HPP92_015094 [Vanilla planifolia]
MQQISALNQSYRDHSLKSMQGTQTFDQFGLLGLLNVIRGNDPNLASLAMGMDLTTLGLNLLSSPGDLHKKFSSPWSDEPAKGEPEYSIPACYYSKPSPLLKQGHFLLSSTWERYSTSFTACQRTRLSCLQLMNCTFVLYLGLGYDYQQALYTRGWFYHKELRLWLMRIGEPLVKTQTYERGSYHYMDPNTWQTIRKDNFVLYYDAVENQAYLP